MSDIKKIERDERQQRREARREKAARLHQGQNPRETDRDEIPPESGYDRQEEGVEEETAPKDEEVWIEKQESLQITVPDEVTLSPVNPHTIIQTIVEDDLRLRAGDITIWSRLGDEPYPRRHLVIR